MNSASNLLALTLAFVGSLHANVIDIQSITGPAGDVDSQATFLINGKGLSTPVTAGMSKTQALTINHELSAEGHLSCWTNSISEELQNAVFIIDLGKDYSLNAAILWQYANHEDNPAAAKVNSLRSFEFIFHTQAEGAKFDFRTEAIEYKGTLAQVSGTGAANNPAQLFHLSTPVARYIALRLVENYGGERLGLGEIRFIGEAPVKKPVSSVTSTRKQHNTPPATLLAIGGVSIQLNSSD